MFGVLKGPALTADSSDVHGLGSGASGRHGATAVLAFSVWLLLVTLSAPGCRPVTDVATSPPPPRESSALAQAPVPRTLEEALATLAAHGSVELFTLVKERREEEAVAELYDGLGRWLRNEWGLWKRGPLYTDLAQRGLHGPEDMSGLVLRSFWRQQRGRPIDVEGQVARYQQYYEAQRAANAREMERRRRTVAAVRAMTAPTRFQTADAPRLRLDQRTHSGLQVTSLARYRAGALLGVKVWEREGAPERFELWYLDAHDTTLRPVRVPELERVHAFTVVNGTCWVVGLAGGHPTLIEVGAPRRTRWYLPRAHELPRLSTYRDGLAVVYENAMYQRTSAGWTPVALDTAMPSEATTLSIHGPRIYVFEADTDPDAKRLRWLEPGNPSASRNVADELRQQMGEFTPDEWRSVRAYAVATTGHLWVLAGPSWGHRSLLERDTNGRYVAHVAAPLLAPSDVPNLSAMTFDPTGALSVAGPAGMYRLHGGVLTTLVTLENTVQDIPEGPYVLQWQWQPEHLVALEAGMYVAAGADGGVYVVTLQPGDRPAIRAVDERMRPVKRKSRAMPIDRR